MFNVLMSAQQKILGLDIPIINNEEKVFVPLNKKGTTGLEIEVLDIVYSDSTESNCKVCLTMRLTATGKDIRLKSYTDRRASSIISTITGNRLDPISDKLGKYHEGLIVSEENNVIPFEGVVRKDSSIIKKECFLMWHNRDYLLAYAGNNLYRFPIYDNNDYIVKEKEKQQAIKREYELQQQSLSAKQDSIYEEQIRRCNKLLTPEYLANWIGASFFTKEYIENDCGIEPSAYNGGYVMYSFPMCGVTMDFEDTNNVCVELSFRLFGEDGYNMKEKLIAYGYKLQNQSRELIAENNFENLQTGKRSVYKCKLKTGDYSTCIIIEGQAMMFTFYRTSK
jgi:hypothetical protein